MRLGVDGRELQAGVRTGIGRYLREVLRAASAGGWSCLVYGDAATRLPERLPGVTLTPLGARWAPWWDQVALPRALARDRVGVFLSPYYKAPLVSRCPAIVTIHDLFFIGYPGRPRPVYDRVLTRVARRCARIAAAVIADSEASRRDIVARLGVAPAKVRVIPVGLGPEFRPTTPDASTLVRYGLRQPYALYVGNFKPHKNVPRLLRAWAGLPGDLRAAHRLVLAGGDRDGRAELEALAGSLGLGDGLAFAGLVADADLPAVYGGAALVVLPSLEEGFGLPALEAMACGTPVVASNRGALPEVVGEAGLLVDPDKDDALEAALTAALSSAELRADLRRRGLARAAEFPMERTAGRVLALCAEVGGAG
ncbi:MAG: glycosyltransferase family 4 protein [Candidatus Rokuibacteriota bacterium]